MSIQDSNNILLREQLGKGSLQMIGAVGEYAAQTGDFYCIYFPITSTITNIVVANGTGDSELHTVMPAGTTLFMRVTDITISSGIAICYTEHDERANQ